MPRLENPAGTMRTSTRGKGWTPRTVWAAAKHRGNSLRTPVCKRKATSYSKQLTTIQLPDVCVLIQMGRIHNSLWEHVFALPHTCVCALGQRISRRCFLKMFRHSSKRHHQLWTDLILINGISARNSHLEYEECFKWPSWDYSLILLPFCQEIAVENLWHNDTNINWCQLSLLII